MTVLFSELQVPGWAESGEKIGLNDVTFTYDDAKAFTLPCHTSDPEIFFADDDAVIAQAKALCGSCPMRNACLDGAFHVKSHAVCGEDSSLKMASLLNVVVEQVVRRR